MPHQIVHFYPQTGFVSTYTLKHLQTDMYFFAVPAANALDNVLHGNDVANTDDLSP